jgi:hypothetical protein
MEKIVFLVLSSYNNIFIEKDIKFKYLFMKKEKHQKYLVEKLTKNK